MILGNFVKDLNSELIPKIKVNQNYPISLFFILLNFQRLNYHFFQVLIRCFIFSILNYFILRNLLFNSH